MKILGNSQQKLLSDCSEIQTISPKTVSKPLGMVLQEAGLVSSKQIEIALEKQEKEYHQRRLGEILALQGWLKPETADFFAERWSILANEQPKQPLGQYFRQAALLNDFQIEVILGEQGKTRLKFGELAVRKSWIEPTTLDFFVKNFTSQPRSLSNLPIALEKNRIESDDDGLEREKEIHHRFLRIRLKLYGLDETSFPISLLEEIMAWTKGHFFLTQKLCQIAAKSNIAAGEEKQKIDWLVRTRIVENWENGVAAEHLTEVRDRLLYNRQCQFWDLLQEYRSIYLQQARFKESAEQTELIELGLVRENQGKLQVSNRIYREVFDLAWIERESSNLSRQSWLMAKSNTQNDNRSAIVVSKASHSTAEANRANRFLSWLTLLIFTGLLGIGIPYMLQRWQVKTLFRESNKLLTTEEYDRAIAGYNKLLNIDSNYYQAWTNRGYALSGLKEYQQMLASCSSATLIEPKAVYAWNCLGEALHNLQRNAEAVEAFDRAIELSPTDSIFFINKSESLIALGQYDEAIADSKRAIEILETREQKEGKNRVAEELAIAWNYQAKSLLKQQQYQPALAAYNRSLQYVAEYFPARIGKGITLNNLQQYSQASAIFESVLRNENFTKVQKAETWFYMGKTLCDSNKILSGVAAFDEALKLKPNYEAAKMARASCR